MHCVSSLMASSSHESLHALPAKGDLLYGGQVGGGQFEGSSTQHHPHAIRSKTY